MQNLKKSFMTRMPKVNITQNNSKLLEYLKHDMNTLDEEN